MKIRTAARFAAVLAVVLAALSARASEDSVHAAAEAGERDAAIALLAAGADPDTRGPDGSTALMWAAYHGDVELARRLVEAGADVGLSNAFGTSALSEAAIIGSAPLIALLLEAGADPNAANPEGETPLMAVARSGDVDGARVLLEAGADPNAKEQWGGQSALMWAAAQGQAEMVELLVTHGADVDARGAERRWERKVIKEPRPKDMNQGGFTPLLYAAREGCIDCAKHLIAGGADPDLHDPHRVPPLSMALLNLHFDFAAYMIEAGADVNKWDLYGRTPLYLAADTSTLPVMGNGAMVVIPSLDNLTALDVGRMLLQAGADPNIQLKRRPPYRNVPQDRGGDSILSMGATPLLRAARAGDAPFVELLLEHGALVDLPSNQGVTPLMAAAGVDYGQRVTRGRNRTDAGVLETMRLLIGAGADVHARNLAERRGETAAHLLVIEQRLGDFSYDYRGRQVPSPRAVPNQTALHGAAARGFTAFVEFLIENGADPHAKDANGRTPIDHARQGPEPKTETVELLEQLMEQNPAATL